MIEVFTGFLTSLRKTSPVIFLGLSLATGIILFSSELFITSLGLENFKTETKGYLGAAFIISMSILISQLSFALFNLGIKQFKKYKSKDEERKNLIKNQEQLHILTPDEKAYLSPYIFNSENTQYFQIEDGVAGGLAAKGFIYQSSNVGSMMTGWAYNIQPWVREYLQLNPAYLEGANPNPEGPPHW